MEKNNLLASCRIEKITIGKHELVVDIPKGSQLDKIDVNYILPREIRKISIECNFSVKDNDSKNFNQLDRYFRSFDVCFGI